MELIYMDSTDVVKGAFHLGKGVHKVGKMLAPAISAGLWGLGAYGVGKGIKGLWRRTIGKRRGN